METTDKKKTETPKDEHGSIPLPEHMDRSTAKATNTPQSTAGSKTPGSKGKNHMSEAAERKARRDGVDHDEKK